MASILDASSCKSADWELGPVQRGPRTSAFSTRAPSVRGVSSPTLMEARLIGPIRARPGERRPEHGWGVLPPPFALARYGDGGK